MVQNCLYSQSQKKIYTHTYTLTREDGRIT